MTLRQYAGVLVVAMVSCFAAAADPNLPELLAAAKPGQTVELPAGEFRGGATLPPGVSLKGAGYAKTVINAVGTEHGISITDGSGATISGLTVRGAAVANVLVQGAKKVTLQRLRATAGLIGVSVQGGHAVRVENVLSDANRYGIIVAGGEDNTVVNCTAVGNATMGLSFPSGKGTVAFNNLVTDGTVAVNVGQDSSDIVLDYNLYLGVSVGKCGRRAEPRETLNDWRYSSGLDAHSVSLPVKFADAASARFAVTNVLEWALDRTVTAGWGTAKLAGRKAPRQDIDGVKRPADSYPHAPGLGAFETSATPPRPADGTFTVPSGKGLVSAGAFDKNGRLVSYLFQTLPLPEGKHPFWLPPRSYIGKPIDPGDYEVRVVKGDLEWQYLGWFGNTGRKDSMGYGAPCTHDGLAFDNDGHFFVGGAASDTFRNLRAADAATGQWLWTLFGGGSMPGATLAIAADGLLYIMRNMGGQGMCITRIQPATGKVVMDGTASGHIVLKEGATFNGFAALGERLCYTDLKGDAVRFGTIKSPEPTTSVTVKAPKYPAADAKAGVVWVISGGEKLVAVSPEGKIVAEVQPVPAPVALAARDGLLAVASTKTGKVHLFDASNPAELRPLRTIGRGDGPDGRVLSDRFFFQDNPTLATDLAIGPRQEIAVADFWRIQVFERDGKVRWSSWGMWGGGNVTSKAAMGRVYDDYGFSYLLDGEKGTWQPESYNRALVGGVMGDCVIGGQAFVLLWGPGWKETLVRWAPDKAEQVLSVEATGQVGKLQQRRDTNGDGRIDDRDTAEPVLDAEGKPLPNMQAFHHMYNTILPDGALVSGQCYPPGSWLSRWPSAGLDAARRARGVPIYRWQDRAPLPGADKFVSPFNWKPDPLGVGQLEPRPGGGWYIVANVTSSPQSGKSVYNNGGTDVIGVDKDGNQDWVRPFAMLAHIGGFASGNGLCLAGHVTTHDFHIMNADGLALPGFSSDSADLDHAQAAVTFEDHAGKVNVLVTDCTKSCNDWFRLNRCDIRTATSRLTVTPATAALLAGLAASPPDFTAGKAPGITFQVPHLKAPLPIDGDMQKWRDAGIKPQLIITPDVGAYRIKGGPRDCSVLFRFAWEGRNLYMQAFKFDDVVTTHNPRERAYMQDTIEMAINSCLKGLKFNFSLTSDAGPVIYADGGQPYKCNVLPPDHAPRVIKVLHNAESVTERQLLESIAGVDMRDCKVELFEARVPIDEKTYAGREDALWELKPGAEFRIGFIIDDNDQPGADTFRFIQWPLGFGYYMPAENGARAVLE